MCILGNPNSYGFIPKRACRDALSRCFWALAKPQAPQWILDADIKGCFDHISHEWMLKHIPMEKRVLTTWLKSGVIDKHVFYQTDEGTPQGGIISPCLCNMVLDGLEAELKQAVPKIGSMVNVTRYADDIVVTGASRKLLEQDVLPTMRKFLAQRGLTLSAEKTKIVSIHEGFDFLGCNVRKYNGKLLIKPSKEKVQAFTRKLKALMVKCVAQSASDTYRQLNATLRGWFTYYRPWVSKDAFCYIDGYVYQLMWWWMKRRHKNRGKQWMYKHYHRRELTPRGTYRTAFSSVTVSKKLVFKRVTVFRLCDLSIVRYFKVKCNVSPFVKADREYYQQRWTKAFLQRKKDKAFLAKFTLVT